MNIFDKLKAAEEARKQMSGQAASVPPERKELSDKLNKPVGGGLQFLRTGKPPESPVSTVSTAPAAPKVAPIAAPVMQERPVVSHGANFQPARQVPLSMSGAAADEDLPTVDELEILSEDEDEDDVADEDDEEFGEMAEINLEAGAWPSIDLDEKTGESLTIRELTETSPDKTPSVSQDSPAPSSSTVMKRLTLPSASQPTVENPPSELPAPPSMPLLKTPSLRLPPTIGLRLPTQTTSSPPPAPSVSQPLPQENAPTTKSASSAENALIAAGGPLGKLLERKYQSPNTAISTGAAACVSAGSDESAISPQEFLDEWNALGDDPDIVHDLNEQRRALLKRVCARLQQIFAAEMDRLTTNYANERSLQELSQLVRLTFIRVKEAPSAWATLDRTEKGAVIQAMVAMAVKRNSAVKGRKPKEAQALSASMETMIVGEGDVMAAFDEVFDGIEFKL